MLPGENLNGAKLSNDNFDNAGLPGCNLASVDKSWAFLVKTDLSETSLTGVCIRAPNLPGAKLKSVRPNQTFTLRSGTPPIRDLLDFLFDHVSGSLGSIKPENQLITSHGKAVLKGFHSPGGRDFLIFFFRPLNKCRFPIFDNYCILRRQSARGALLFSHH